MLEEPTILALLLKDLRTLAPNFTDITARARHLASAHGRLASLDALLATRLPESEGAPGKHLVDADARNGQGDTALITAVKNTKIKAVQALLGSDRNIDVDARNKNGDTALIVAVRRNDREAVEALLSKGANPRLKNLAGKDALAITQDQQFLSLQLLLLKELVPEG
jgi:ankyrin repeat protein